MKKALSYFFKNSVETILVGESDYYHALNDFHSHPEIELIYIAEGRGKLLVGDKFDEVATGQLILIGYNVPHMFRFATYTYQNDLMQQGKVNLTLKLLTLHFDPKKFGDSFWSLPENSLLSTICKTQDCIFIQKDLIEDAVMIMGKLISSESHEDLPLLFGLFTKIALGENRKVSYQPSKKLLHIKSDEKRLTLIYLYTLQNFSKTIRLSEVSNLVHMVPNAFCKYFKSRTQKSYFDFLLEMRIDHACKLLKEKDYSIVVICYESGFSNISNFNRQFKHLKGKTPLDYRKYSRN